MPDSTFTEAQFCTDPADYFGHSYTRAHSVDRHSLDALQLAGLKWRYGQLQNTVPFLARLSEEQRIDSIETLDDVVPLLFEHGIYKSYPPEWLESMSFPKINRWLNKLTNTDLANIDVSDCDSIDRWIGIMNQQSEIVPWVSSGTSGIMTFMPHSKEETESFVHTCKMNFLQRFGEEADSASQEELHEIWPFFRYPGGGMNLDLDLRVEHFLGGHENRLHSLFEGASSLDVRYIQARMRKAEASGTLDQLDISPELLKRKDAHDEFEKAMPEKMMAFLDECCETLKGKRIFMMGTWPLLYNLAARGLAAGRKNVFAADSYIFSGGGLKGTTLPDNWQDEVRRFTGVQQLGGMYGMTEGLARHMLCEHDNFHFCPWVIPFVLDPDTSSPLPREGRVSGRFAFYDLLASSHWGGLITGDKVTVEWSEPCACGQQSAHIVGNVSRYADERGGKDVVAPAANKAALEKAMTFLTVDSQ